jgi:hypothetical protein
MSGGGMRSAPPLREAASKFSSWNNNKNNGVFMKQNEVDELLMLE